MPRTHPDSRLETRWNRRGTGKPNAVGLLALIGEFQACSAVSTASNTAPAKTTSPTDAQQIRGKWSYIYRAVDREGQTVDFRLSASRDVKAAKAFFRKAPQTQGRPPVSITLGGYAASHRAVRELPAQSSIASAKASSIWAGCAWQAKPRLQFGTPCFRPDSRQRAHEVDRPARNFHQSRHKCNTLPLPDSKWGRIRGVGMSYTGTLCSMTR